MDFCLRVSATAIALPIRGVLFCLIILSEIKTQNFRDDALLVKEMYSFIYCLLNE